MFNLQALSEPEFMSKTVVILAGYENKIDQMMTTNEGLRSRFAANKIMFPDMTEEHVRDILVAHLQRTFKLDLAPDAAAVAVALARRMKGMPTFSNGRTAKTWAQEVNKVWCRRWALGAASRVTADDLQVAATKLMETMSTVGPKSRRPPIDMDKIKSIDDVFASQGLVGCEDIKARLHEVEAIARAAAGRRRDGGRGSDAGTDAELTKLMNYLFVGKPGTGACAPVGPRLRAPVAHARSRVRCAPVALYTSRVV